MRCLYHILYHAIQEHIINSFFRFLTFFRFVYEGMAINFQVRVMSHLSWCSNLRFIQLEARNAKYDLLKPSIPQYRNRVGQEYKIKCGLSYSEDQATSAICIQSFACPYTRLAPQIRLFGQGNKGNTLRSSMNSKHSREKWEGEWQHHTMINMYMKSPIIINLIVWNSQWFCIWLTRC